MEDYEDMEYEEEYVFPEHDTRHDNLRGFESLRTRLPEPRERSKQQRRCAKCGAVLSRYNPNTLCKPCYRGEIEIPEWAKMMIATGVTNDIIKAAMILRREYGLEAEPKL